MPPADQRLPARLIRGSDKRYILLLVVSLLFVAGSLAIYDPESPAVAILGAGFFGLCAVIFLVLIIRPMQLRLDADGYTLTGGLLRTPQTTKWRDLAGPVFLWSSGGAPMPAFNYRPDYPNNRRARAVSRNLGAEGAVAGKYELKAPELAALMERYRLAAGGIEFTAA